MVFHIIGAAEIAKGNMPVAVLTVLSLEVSGFPQFFQEPFRHFAAFWAIEITTELLFVGMAIASPLRVLFKPFEGGYEPTPHTTCQARRSTAPS